MKDKSKMEWEKEKDFLYGLMEINIKGNGLKI